MRTILSVALFFGSSLAFAGNIQDAGCVGKLLKARSQLSSEKSQLKTKIENMPAESPNKSAAIIQLLDLTEKIADLDGAYISFNAYGDASEMKALLGGSCE